MTGINWGDPNAADYAQQNIVSINVDGLKFQVNENIATQMYGFIHALVQAGYHPKAVEGYNNRNIAGSKSKSNHAYGAAIDIDPGANPRYGNGKGGTFALPANVGQLAAQYGLVWGGNYQNSKDYMHFEAATAPATPQAIARSSGALTYSSGGGVAAASTAAPAPTKPAATTAPGQVGDASMGQTLGPNSTDQQVKDYISKNYGYLVGFVHDPELGPLLLQAAREGWDKDVLAGKLTQTKYWKTTSDTARMWDAQTHTDPAAQHQLVGNKMAELSAEAKKLGVVISPLKLHDLAVTSMRLGWNPDQIDAGLRAQGTLDSRSGSARDFDQLAKDDPASAKQAVQNQTNTISQEAVKLGVTFQGPKAHDIAVNALRFGWDTNRIRTEILAQGILSPTGTGAIQTGVSSLKASAGDYLVKVSDPTLLQWSKDIASGKFTQDDFTNYLKEQAKSLFPGLASAIDRGITPNHYVDPYRQYAASILDVNPDSIDFVNDPKYSKALFNIDPKTGERTQMSLADWQTYLRQQPEYANTAGAVDQGAQFATMLTKTFGATA